MLRNSSKISDSGWIVNIGQLAVPAPVENRVPPNPLKILRNVWIKVRDGKIERVGPEGELMPLDADPKDCWDAEGMLATPGLIDAHTHPVFANTRQAEFVLRCQGASYQEIAAAGGGILNSVKGVRAATEEELSRKVKTHLDNFLAYGVTAIEGKSGYGLTLEDEMKQLRALRIAAENHPVEVSPTLLGAHVVPVEYKHDSDAYVDIVVREMIPQAVEQKLAESVDVFLEEGAYNLDQARRIFQAGKDAGLGLRIHADQFTSGGGAELAAEFKALTADHFDRTDPANYAALAEAGVTIVLLPGAVFFLGLDEYAPARRMVEAGCRIALSTDFNPGSTPTQSLPLMMTFACVKMGLTPDEALWAATYGAAKAIKREKFMGTTAPGYNCDLCLWNAEDVNYLPYSYGNMIPAQVFKKGRLVAKDGRRV